MRGLGLWKVDRVWRVQKTVDKTLPGSVGSRGVSA